jgi:hypothetical protein
LAARLDAVAGKLQSTSTVQNISKDFGYLVRAIDKAMSQMDLIRVSQVMSKFESQFEDLDVRGEEIGHSIMLLLLLMMICKKARFWVLPWLPQSQPLPRKTKFKLLFNKQQTNIIWRYL